MWNMACVIDRVVMILSRKRVKDWASTWVSGYEITNDLRYFRMLYVSQKKVNCDDCLLCWYVIWLQPVSAIPVTTSVSGSNVINVVGNPSQPVPTAIQPRSGLQLIAQQPSVTSAVPVVLPQSAVASRLVQPSVTAVTASNACQYTNCVVWFLVSFVSFAQSPLGSTQFACMSVRNVWILEFLVRISTWIHKITSVIVYVCQIKQCRVYVCVNCTRYTIICHRQFQGEGAGGDRP